MPEYLSRLELYVGGSLRNALQVSAATSLNQGVDTCNLTIVRGASVTPGDRIELRMGLNNAIDYVFIGEVEEHGIAYYPTETQLAGVGQLYKARKKTNRVIAPATIPDPDLPLPEKIAYEALGKADEVIVAELLALAGCTNVSLQGTGLPLTTIRPVKLRTGASAWGLIQEIDKRTWYRTFGAADGSIRRAPYTILPSTSPALTLVEGVDLFDGKRIQTRSGMYTNVHVKGISFIGANDYPITIEYATNEPEENAYGINDVLEFASDLFESEADAGAWATKALGEYGKLQERVNFTLAKGETRLKTGMTVGITSPTMGFGSGARFLVEEVRHYSDGVEFLTAATFRGSAEPTGSSANQAPIPLIVIRKIDREYLEGGQVLDIVSLDGSGSYDPDGTIALFTWAGSPVAPVPIGDGKKATVAYLGGIPAGATVTLTVADAQGKVASKTLPIVATLATPVQVRDLWAAVGGALLHTINGGKAWTAIAIPAVGVVAEAAPTYTLAWDAAGNLYKVLADNSYTIVIPAAGITAASIHYDAAGTFTGLCFAASSSGAFYRSINEGATWTGVYNPGQLVGSGAPGDVGGLVREAVGSPFAEGQIKAVAGKGLYQSYDGGARWEKMYEHPTASEARSFAGGFDRNWSGFELGTPRVKEWGSGAVVTFPNNDGLVQPVALTMAIEEAILWILGTDGAGQGGAWEADGSAGGAAIRKYWNTITHGLARHAIRDGAIPGLVYVAAQNALVKTVDGFASTLTLKNMGAGQDGRRIGFGLLHPEEVIAGLLTAIASPMNGTAWQTSEKHAIRLTATGWVDLGIVPIVTDYPDTRLLRFGAGRYIAWNYVINDSGGSPSAANCVISLNDCATWQDSGLVAVISVAATDGGELFALAVDGPYAGAKMAGVLHSADNGATWDRRSTVQYNNTAVQVFATQIAVHPTDAAIVAIKTLGGIQVSSDGGVTFGAVIGPGQGSANIHGRGMIGGAVGFLWISNNPTGLSTVRQLEYGASVATESPQSAASLAEHFQRFGSRYIVGTPTAMLDSLDGGQTWLPFDYDAQAIVPQEAGALALSAIGGVTGLGPFVYSNFWLRRSASGETVDLTQQQIEQLGKVYRAWGGSVTD